MCCDSGFLWVACGFFVVELGGGDMMSKWLK